MKHIGYGQGYAYDHDVEEGYSGDNYLPEEMTAETFYRRAGRFLRGERERDPRPSRPQRRRQDLHAPGHRPRRDPGADARRGLAGRRAGPWAVHPRRGTRRDIAGAGGSEDHPGPYGRVETAHRPDRAIPRLESATT